MPDKKVLIITYYWPPSGGSGVQRWLKFVKYLPGFGWTPSVLTPANPSFTIQDESLLKDVPAGVVVNTLPIWEPYDLFFRFSRWFGKKDVKQSDFISTGKKTRFQQLSSWIRGNFFIPDARIFWVNPAVAFAENFLRDESIHTVITTGPPHSIHLIGLKLKRRTPSLTWIADFRDPWSEWDLLDTLSLTAASRRKHQALEKAVLTEADQVITIAPYHVRRFEALGKRKVELVTNGFDEDDFRGIQKKRTEFFTLRHVGVVDQLRDPRPVMEVIRELCAEDPVFGAKVRVEFIGNVNSAFRQYVQGIPELLAITTFVDHLPHRELLGVYGETDLQLLVLAYTVIAPGNLPGKFFEYLASGNPILALGPTDGDAAAILRQTGAGSIVEHTDRAGIKSLLKAFYADWLRGGAADSRDISPFTRKVLTRQLARILES